MSSMRRAGRDRRAVQTTASPLARARAGGWWDATVGRRHHGGALTRLDQTRAATATRLPTRGPMANQAYARKRSAQQPPWRLRRNQRATPRACSSQSGPVCWILRGAGHPLRPRTTRFSATTPGGNSPSNDATGAAISKSQTGATHQRGSPRAWSGNFDDGAATTSYEVMSGTRATAPSMTARCGERTQRFRPGPQTICAPGRFAIPQIGDDAGAPGRSDSLRAIGHGTTWTTPPSRKLEAYFIAKDTGVYYHRMTIDFPVCLP